MSRRKDKDRLPDWDDGRTIVNMDVDGMPWSGPARRHARHRREDSAPAQQRPDDQDRMTDRESRYYTFGALGAALLVVGVISAGIVLFVLFCLHVWFKH